MFYYSIQTHENVCDIAQTTVIYMVVQ